MSEQHHQHEPSEAGAMTRTAAEAPDLAALRRRLRQGEGPGYWRSLDELAGDEAFVRRLGDEFAPGAHEWLDPASRRSFLKLMGASLALAGVVGCSDFPQETIVPYVDPPENVVPGRPTFYATTMPFNGFAHGVLAESHEGRPTKIEGNPDHPASLGATNVFLQASVLDLYDPDRSKLVTEAGNVSSWGDFYNALQNHLDRHRGKGDGLRFLTRTVTSPTFAAQWKEVKKRFPGARWHVYDPTDRAGCCARNGGAPGQAVYDFAKADVILSLDADFVFADAGSLAYARQFIDGRRRDPGQSPDAQRMNRLYVVECFLSLTGSMADHRRAVKPSQVLPVARAIAAKLGVAPAGGAAAPAGLEQFVQAVADDLRKPQNAASAKGAGGTALVVAGDHQPPELQALAYAMNQALGAVGKAVRYIEPVALPGGESLQSLVSDMDAGKVDALLILGGNPAYDAPADVPFNVALQRLTTAVGPDGKPAHFTARLGTHEDETSYACRWHLPETHYLEAWGDARAFDGTASIVQPLILPLNQASRSVTEIMEAVLGRQDRSGYEAVRATWEAPWEAAHPDKAAGPQTRPAVPRKPPTKQSDAESFDEWWQMVLRKGVIEGSAAKPKEAGGGAAEAGAPAGNPAGAGGWELVFRPDAGVWDGSFANNPWLQELPRPFTKLVWDNAAHISYRTAERLKLMDGGVVRITSAGRTIHAPVLVVPGTPDDTLTLSLGYARKRAGHVANDGGELVRGYDAYALLTAASPGFAAAAAVEAVPYDFRQLVMTRSHHAMADLPGLHVEEEDGKLAPHAVETPEMPDEEIAVNNRKLVRSATLAQFRAEPNFVARLGGDVELRKKGLSDEPDLKGRKIHLTLFPTADNGGWDYSKGYKWGMSIDATACIGCNACVIACQAENNIPTVGKTECGRQREMHWLRVDDWFGPQPGGSELEPLDEPHVTHMPVPCQHCENAPCELVCPVGATTHSAEGINEMTYNRCVGTRYCSNNCPYKVRRFNFFLFADYTTPTRALQYNPDVTVRSRGVMEKCTYCVQRVNNTRMEIEKMAVRLQETARTVEKDDPRRAEALRELVNVQQRQMLEQLQTACQQACPTEAIVFGDLNAAASRVGKLKEDKLDYTLLADLTTQPRTSYMARIRNANPRLAAGQHVGGKA